MTSPSDAYRMGRMARLYAQGRQNCPYGASQGSLRTKWLFGWDETDKQLAAEKRDAERQKDRKEVEGFNAKVRAYLHENLKVKVDPYIGNFTQIGVEVTLYLDNEEISKDHCVLGG